MDMRPIHTTPNIAIKRMIAPIPIAARRRKPASFSSIIGASCNGYRGQARRGGELSGFWWGAVSGWRASIVVRLRPDALAQMARVRGALYLYEI